MRSIYSQYDKLNHAERLAMIFRAHARNDAAEVRRLCASLPRSSTSSDPVGFCRQLLGLMAGATLVAGEIRHAMGLMEGYARAGAAMHLLEQHNMARMVLLQLELVSTASRLPSESVDSIPARERCAVPDAGRTDMEAIAIESALNPLIDGAAKRVAGLIAGISSVAEQLVGIDAATVLAALFPDLWAEITTCRVDSLEPDAAAKADAIHLVKQCWRASVDGEVN